jgi:uncharacterized protein YcgL (UPF0745 family)
MQNIIDKHADQLTEIFGAPYYIHMLPLLNRRGWKELIFKNVCIC